jgi:UDP-glucose 4-epimerase
MRVAVTGCTSDFGTAILPALFADPEIDEVIGTGRSREPRARDPKLRFERHDIRSPELERCFAGCDVVVHLAFAVEEMHDKKLSHDINVGGTENVIRCAHAAGAGGVVIASSVSAYGIHDWPDFVTEDAFPRGNHDRYYFYDKAEVEHYVEWWTPRNPGMRICLLRAPFVVGPSFSNTALSMLTTPVLPYPDPDTGAIQLVHERDLASAFHLAVKLPVQGAYNIASRDLMRISELGKIHGQHLIPVPEGPARRVTDALYALRLTPGSGDWVLSGEATVDATRFRNDTGWSPRFTTRELAHVMVLQHGRGVVHTEGELQRREVAEAALEPSTRVVSGWCDEQAELRALIGGSTRFEEALAGVEHVFVGAGRVTVHLEVHRAESGLAQGTVLVTPGPGAHARLYTPAAAALAERGFDVVTVDLPGHGLSTGHRGHAPPRLARQAIEAARGYAERQLTAPLYLDGASTPGASPRSLALLARVAPRTPISVRALVRMLDVRLPAYVSDQLESRTDPLTCRMISAGTAAACAQVDPVALARQMSFAHPLRHPPLRVAEAQEGASIAAAQRSNP